MIIANIALRKETRSGLLDNAINTCIAINLIYSLP